MIPRYNEINLIILLLPCCIVISGFHCILKRTNFVSPYSYNFNKQHSLNCFGAREAGEQQCNRCSLAALDPLQKCKDVSSLRKE